MANMRRLPGVLSVAGAVAVLTAGCSVTSPERGPGASSSAVAPAAPTAPPGSWAGAGPRPPKRFAEPLPDAAALLQESSTATAQSGSVHLSLSVIGEIDTMGITALDADVTEQPAPAARGYAKIGYRGAAAYVAVVVFGGRLYVSQEQGRWVDYGPASNFYDPARILSPDTGLADLLTGFVDPEVEQREMLGDVATVRITGGVSADAAKEIVPQLQATKRTACTAWIQENDAHHLVALELASGDDAAVQLRFSDWGAPVTVGQPPT